MDCSHVHKMILLLAVYRTNYWSTALRGLNRPLPIPTGLVWVLEVVGLVVALLEVVVATVIQVVAIILQIGFSMVSRVGSVGCRIDGISVHITIKTKWIASTNKK